MGGPVKGELARLRTYAHEATKAITGLTSNGSEFFAGKIGSLYVADLPFCVQRVRERDERNHNIIKREIYARRDAEAEVAKCHDVMKCALLILSRVEIGDWNGLAHPATMLDVKCAADGIRAVLFPAPEPTLSAPVPSAESPKVQS